jgi:hypothetical protein
MYSLRRWKKSVVARRLGRQPQEVSPKRAFAHGGGEQRMLLHRLGERIGPGTSIVSVRIIKAWKGIRLSSKKSYRDSALFSSRFIYYLAG